MARKVTPIPYLTIQHDCQIDFAQVLENSDPEATATFWSSAYKQGDESIHDDIKIAKSPSNKDSLVLEGSKGIELTYENKRTLLARCKSLGLDFLKVSFPQRELRPNINEEGVNKSITSFDIAPTEDLYVAGGIDGNLAVYDLERDTRRMDLNGHIGDITTCRFFPSGQVVLSSAFDLRLKIWSAIDGTNPVTLNGHTGLITDTAIIGIGRNILSSSKDGTVRLWNCGTASQLVRFHVGSDAVNCLSLGQGPQSLFSTARREVANEHETQEKIFIAGTAGGEIKIYDILGKVKIATSVSRNAEPVTAVAYQPNTYTFLSGTSLGVIEAWDIRNPTEPTHAIQRNDAMINDLKIILDNEQRPALLAACNDGCCFMTSDVDQDQDIHTQQEFIGPDLDALFNIWVTTRAGHPTRIWSAGKDGLIRMY